MPYGEHRVQCHHCGTWYTCGDCITFTCHDCDQAGHRGLFIDCPKCEEETRARREERARLAPIRQSQGPFHVES